MKAFAKVEKQLCYLKGQDKKLEFNSGEFQAGLSRTKFYFVKS